MPPDPRLPRSPSRRATPLAGTLLLAVLLTACGAGTGDGTADREGAAPREAEGGAVVHVVASIPPLAWFVERIGGDRVVVETFIPPGASPHAFEPTPRQVAGLEDADLVVTVGHPDFTFETHHLERLARQREGVELVRFSEGLELEAEHGEGGHGMDPHLWVAPELARPAAGRIAAALSRLDPAGAEAYRRNLAGLLADVDALDRHVRDRLSGLPHRTFLVQHPSWGHFARQYGLRQVAIEEEGKEPSPQRLVELIRQTRREPVRVVFVQPGVSAAAAESLAAEIGARVVPLDPLARDWLSNLRHVADALHEALAEGGAP